VVATKYFYSGEPAESAVTDANGVALVNSKGTIITAIGSTFVGNYRVNATLTYGATKYYSDDPAEISIGVAPYTEPLTSNTTYAVLRIPSALPDLTLVADPISSDPISPKFNQATTLSIRVDNVGPVAAHNVTADFYDNADAIGSGNVSAIPAGGFATISIVWSADSPLAPDSHTIYVEVDPDNTVPELVEPAPGSVLNASKVITVRSLPDVHLTTGGSDFYTTPTAIVINVPVQVNIRVYNTGTYSTGDVLVEFFAEPISGGSSLIGTTTLTPIAPGSFALASVTWVPATNESHNIRVLANGGRTGTHTFDELTFENNEAVKTFSVLDPPDLWVFNMVFSPTERVSGGDVLVITATVMNTQPAPFENPAVALYKDAPVGLPLMTTTIYQTLASGGTASIRFEYQTPEVDVSQTWVFVISVNPNHSPAEQTYANNVVSGSIMILDVRPDLHVTSESIEVIYGQDEVQSSTFGRTLMVYTTVDNLGGRSTSFSFQLNISGPDGYNVTLLSGMFNVSAETTNHTTTIAAQWNVRLNPGAYQLWAWVDREGAVNEANEANNIAYIDFTIVQLYVDVTTITDELEYTAGDDIIVSLTIEDAVTGQPVPDVPLISVWLATANNFAVVEGSTVVVNGDAQGHATAIIPIPIDISTGSYVIRTRILSVDYPPSTADIEETITVSAQVEGGWLPMWLLLLIIVVIGASIGGFTVYTYKYGLGKYVECGECGAFIPAASKRCPKCGVEFEVGTMKCSECGAWIPAESTECPNCGVKFAGEIEEEGDYLERMKKQYDEEIVSKYKELAKVELGKKFKDDVFEAWFKRQPGYISFDDWLAKEEEKKKEGPVPCPVCGTLNPKEATVCHKCGTVFAAAGAPPPGKGPPPGAPPSGQVLRQIERPVEPQAEGAPPEAQAPAAAPRMVIRRPIDRKVVPKKIIKTPVGEETKEGEGNNEGGEGQ
jgi:ribosomal protein L40E